MFEIWSYIWWAWLFLLAIFFIGFSTQHMKFSKMLGYVVSILLIYFFVIRHPVWGSVWFVVSFIFTTGIFWPGNALFNIGAEYALQQKYKGAAQQQGGDVGSGLPQFGGR